jgi:hypothetical protein
VARRRATDKWFLAVAGPVLYDLGQV